MVLHAVRSSWTGTLQRLECGNPLAVESTLGVHILPSDMKQRFARTLAMALKEGKFPIQKCLALEFLSLCYTSFKGLEYLCQGRLKN